MGTRGELLSPSDVIHHIDQFGNRDGIATLTDIQPYLNPDQKALPPPPPPDLWESLQTLDRICGPRSNASTLASLFSNCRILQGNRFDHALLTSRTDSFVWLQFDRLFLNPIANDMFKQRYKEFKEFVRQYHISLSELYRVLENWPSFEDQPPERQQLEKIPLDKQADFLFKLSLYAAMWHLKYNLKTFSPEELLKCPDWFRKRVTGFEDNILMRLKDWKIRVILGDKRFAEIFTYSPTTKSITTPAKNFFPAILQDVIGTAYHELFHAYRSSQVIAEPFWTGERDAHLVETIILMRHNKVSEKDKEAVETLARREFSRVYSEPTDDPIEKEYREKRLQQFLKLYQYAAWLTVQNRKSDLGSLTKALEERMIWELVIRFFNMSKINEDRFSDYSDPEIVKLIINEEIEKMHQQIHVMESQTYVWSPEGSQRESVNFFEMLRRLNQMCQSHSERFTESFLELHKNYLRIASEYTLLTTTVERLELILRRVSQGKDPIGTMWVYDFHKTFSLLGKHKWVYVVRGHH